MEYDIRTALMIISAIAILAILVHGLWKIRKNKNPYKLKAKAAAIEPVARNFDGSGFDQDGVGQIKVKGTNALTGEIENPPQEHEIPRQPAPAPTYNEEPLPTDIFDKELSLAQEPEIEPQLRISSADIESIEPAVVIDNSSKVNLATEAVTREPLREVKVTSKPVYDAPVTAAKPSFKVPAKTRKITQQQKEKIDQIEINFDDIDANSASQPQAAPKKVKKVDIEQEVIVLSIVVGEEQSISGAALLPILLTLGMKYGDMNIFHRHEDNAGNGKVTFSLANMMNPGTFDLDAIESFSTQGVSLFMTLPNAGDAFKVFEQMLAAAKQIAQEFRGQLLDDKRSVMTKQTEQHYICRIREFDRKYRIAAI